MLGQREEARLDQDEGDADDADRLAEDGARKDALCDGVGEYRHRVGAHDAYLRVHKGKERQDDEVHRRGEVALGALQGRAHMVHHALHSPGGGGEVVLAEDVRLVVVLVVELDALGVEPAAQVVQADVGTHGQEEGQDHAGERRVDARVVHAEPQDDADDRIGFERVDARAAEEPQAKDGGERGGDPHHVDRLPVEERQDDDREDIVGDRQGLEEDLGLRRDAVAEQGHHADGKGDVGGDGGGPAVCGTAGVDREVDQGGCRDAADRGEHGEGCLFGVT